MNKNLFNIVKKLCAQMYPNINSESIIKRYFSLVNKMIVNNGLIHTTKVLKQMRLHCTRYICGKPLYTNDMLISIDKDGWPKALDFLKPFAATGNVEKSKFLMTILTISRSFKLSKEDQARLIPDYESITKPSGMSKIIPSGFINRFVKKYNLKADGIRFTEPYLSTKAGPVGPTTLTAQKTLVYYSYPNLQRLYNLTNKEGEAFLDKQYNLSWNLWQSDDTPKSLKDKVIGKLSFVFDPECKLRIVAIVDYYTQLVLKSIHEDLMKLIKNLPCDRTYTQDPTHDWIENSESFWSIDLSSATDRFPIDLQRRLIERIYGDKALAQNWKSMLSEREFLTPEGNMLKYSAGQPMGSYSSWIAFTLSHHLLVHWCAHLCGEENFNQYILLGDDIVIKNDKIARKYISWCKFLGVETSVNKTHVSKDTYEFAKRWYTSGREITGIALNGIVWNITNPFIVISYLYDYFKVKNNQYLYRGNLSDFVQDFYSRANLRNKGGKYISINSKIKSRLRTFCHSLDITFGYATYDTIRSNLAHHIKNDLYHFPCTFKLILSDVKGVMAQGVTSSIISNSEAISKLVDTLESKLSKLGLSDINDLGDYPILIAIKNYVTNLKSKITTWSHDENMDVNQACKDIVMLNIDAYFDKERNKILSIMKIGEVYNKGIKLINSTDEIYYGSATVESTYTFARDLTKLIPSSVDETIDKLEKISNKQMVKEEKFSAYTENAWANFFS